MKAVWTVALAWLAPLLAQAEPLDIQLGAWEVTTKVSDPRRTVVETHCLPERSLMPWVQGPDLIEDDPCYPTAPPKTGRHAWAIILQCEDGSQVHARFAAKTPQSITGTVVRVGGKRRLLQKLEISGRWLRPRCAVRR